MGREFKRVPLNFDWPLNKVWGGYINPFWSQRIDCPNCNGNGYSSEYKNLQDKWYGYVPFHPKDRESKPFLPTDKNVLIRAGNDPYEAKRLCDLWNEQWCHHLNQDDVNALLEAGRLWDFTRVPITQEQKELVKKRVDSGKHNSWLPYDNGYKPTPEEVNNWSIFGFGHDSLNSHIVIEAECHRLGYETNCKRCEGDGSLWPTAEIKFKHEAWEKIDPPIGDGFQLWETVSEGSPISPVFATENEFVEYLVKEGYSREVAVKFIEVKRVLSGTFHNSVSKKDLNTLELQ